jgi:hypothetical protein
VTHRTDDNNNTLRNTQISNVTEFNTNQFYNSKIDDTQRSRPSSAPHQRPKVRNDFGTLETTKSILGKSVALKELSQQRTKGRQGAKTNYVTLDWNEDHYRLVDNIHDRREEVTNLMEARRKILAMSQERQLKTMNKYRTIRERIKNKRANYNWAKNASYEVMTLDRIANTIREDSKKQQCNAIRATEHIRWTMAPNGFANRRGKSLPGYLIGPGPLPADATTALHDPRMQHTVKSYKWDEHGRRHVRKPDEVDAVSSVEEALTAIRKAATNASLYKLDLKQVFDSMDTSGDGFLTLPEMDQAFKLLGVALSNEILLALFRYNTLTTDHIL